MASENVKSGYCEGLLRGYRGGLLTAADYNNLSQCENLDDVKLHLNTTDYGPYLANEPSPLHPATIVEKCTQKLVDEWNHLRCQVRFQWRPACACDSQAGCGVVHCARAGVRIAAPPAPGAPGRASNPSQRLGRTFPTSACPLTHTRPLCRLWSRCPRSWTTAHMAT